MIDSINLDYWWDYSSLFEKKLGKKKGTGDERYGIGKKDWILRNSYFAKRKSLLYDQTVVTKDGWNKLYKIKGLFSFFIYF